MKKSVIILWAICSLSSRGADSIPKSFLSEAVHVLVTRVDAARVNQAELVGYFQGAHFYVHRSLIGSGRPASPAKFSLDPDFKQSVTGRYQIGSQERAEWLFSGEAFLPLLKDRGLLHREDLAPYSSEPQGTVLSHFDSDVKHGHYFFLPRVSKGVVDQKPSYHFPPPDTSLLVEFGTPEVIERLYKSILPGMDGTGDSSAEGLPAAWKAGSSLYGRHYRTFSLSVTSTYQGPDREDPKKKLGEFAVAIHARAGNGVLVVPSLERPGENEEIQAATRRAVAPVSVNLIEWTNSEQTKLSAKMDAAEFLSKIFAPAVLRSEPETELHCLINENSSGRSGCAKDGEKQVIYFATTMSDDEEPKAFYVTDADDNRVWKIEMKLQESKSYPLSGDYLPIQDSRK